MGTKVTIQNSEDFAHVIYALREGKDRHADSNTILATLLTCDESECPNNPIERVDALLIKATFEKWGRGHIKAETVLMSLGLFAGYNYKEMSAKMRRKAFLKKSRYLDLVSRSKIKDFDTATTEEQEDLIKSLRKNEEKYINKMASDLFKKRGCKEYKEYIENDSDYLIKCVDRYGKSIWSVNYPYPSFDEEHSLSQDNKTINIYTDGPVIIQPGIKPKFVSPDANEPPSEKSQKKENKTQSNAGNVVIDKIDAFYNKHSKKINFVLFIISFISSLLNGRDISLFSLKKQMLRENVSSESVHRNDHEPVVSDNINTHLENSELPTIESITLPNKQIFIQPGGHYFIEPIIIPSEASDERLVYDSSNPNVLIVLDDTGEAIALKKVIPESAGISSTVTVSSLNGKMDKMKFIITEGSELYNDQSNINNDSLREPAFERE